MGKTVFLKLMRPRCLGRGLDTAKIAKYFEMNGYKQTNDSSLADFIVIVTCGVLEDIQERAIKHIKELNEKKGELIVLGCLPGIVPEKIKKIFKGKRLTPDRLNEIDKFFPEFTVKFKNVPEQNFPLLANTDEEAKLQKINHFLSRLPNIKKHLYPDSGIKIEGMPDKKTKTGIIRITNGCLESCSYCLINKATGRLRSKPLKKCIEEYKSLIFQGCNVVLFDGEEIGAYGVDIKTALPVLLEKIVEIDKQKKAKWIFRDMSPRWAILYQKSLLKHVKEKRIAGFGLAFQSGSQRILGLMRRNYSIQDLKDLFKKFKQADPKINLFTQFIIGFPTETFEEFMDSLNLAKDLDIGSAQFFRYNEFNGSASYSLPNKVSQEEITRRMDIVKREMKSFLKKEQINKLFA